MLVWLSWKWKRERRKDYWTSLSKYPVCLYNTIHMCSSMDSNDYLCTCRRHIASLQRALEELREAQPHGDASAKAKLVQHYC